MDKKIVIISDGSLFPQRINATESLHIDVIEKKFREKGFEITKTTYDEIINKNILIENSFVFYASSQIKERKLYIDDILYTINKPSRKNVLLPNYEVFRCHENKGFQEIYKKDVGINSLGASYHIDYQRNEENATFVLKLLEGYGSKGVFLVKNDEDFKKIYDKRVRIKNYKLLLKQYLKKLLNKKITKEQNFYFMHLQSRRYVKQPLIPSLECDYKVLIFSTKVYVLKRYVKKNDFRASGSGIWELANENNIPVPVLDFSYDCYKKLDLPFVSLDVCFDGKRSHLIEFQGVHFGPVTLLTSNGYFDKKQSWRFVEARSNLEEEMANSLFDYCESVDIVK